MAVGLAVSGSASALTAHQVLAEGKILMKTLYGDLSHRFTVEYEGLIYLCVAEWIDYDAGRVRCYAARDQLG